jgi:hypothetical protein
MFVEDFYKFENGNNLIKSYFFGKVATIMDNSWRYLRIIA